MRTPRTVFLVSIALIAVLSSCAKRIIHPTEDRHSLNIVDNVEERRFDLVLASSDDQALCISVENWPNSSGHFTIEKEDVFLQIGDDLLPARSPLMSAYCPGGCGQHRIEPHGELRGYIAYEAFGGPAQVAGEREKQLRFSVRPYYCRDR